MNFNPQIPAIPLVVITGPTASGKSELALQLAQQFDGEIVCTDSMQIYRKLDIGTAKPTLTEQQIVPHHQLDLIEPDEHYSAGQYARDTWKIIKDLQKRRKIPFLTGGAGLYYQAVLYGFDPMPKIPEEIRQKVLHYSLEQGLSSCYQKLQKDDPKTAQRIHPNDKSRILRALEILKATGSPISSFQQSPTARSAKFPLLSFAIADSRENLYQRINQRTWTMLENGWIEEVEALLHNYSPSLPSLQAIGYRQIIQFLQGKLEREAMIAMVQQKTRNFAKRQLTWFRKDQQIQWVSRKEPQKIAEKIKKILNETLV